VIFHIIEKVRKGIHVHPRSVRVTVTPVVEGDGMEAGVSQVLTHMFIATAVLRDTVDQQGDRSWTPVRHLPLAAELVGSGAGESVVNGSGGGNVHY